MFGGVRIDTVTLAPARTSSPARSMPLLPAPTTSTRWSANVCKSRTCEVCSSWPANTDSVVHSGRWGAASQPVATTTYREATGPSGQTTVQP